MKELKGLIMIGVSNIRFFAHIRRLSHVILLLSESTQGKNSRDYFSLFWICLLH